MAKSARGAGTALDIPRTVSIGKQLDEAIKVVHHARENERHAVFGVLGAVLEFAQDCFRHKEEFEAFCGKWGIKVKEGVENPYMPVVKVATGGVIKDDEGKDVWAIPQDANITRWSKVIRYAADQFSKADKEGFVDWIQDGSKKGGGGTLTAAYGRAIAWEQSKDKGEQKTTGPREPIKFLDKKTELAKEAAAAMLPADMAIKIDLKQDGAPAPGYRKLFVNIAEDGAMELLGFAEDEDKRVLNELKKVLPAYEPPKAPRKPRGPAKPTAPQQHGFILALQRMKGVLVPGDNGVYVVIDFGEDNITASAALANKKDTATILVKAPAIEGVTGRYYMDEPLVEAMKKTTTALKGAAVTIGTHNKELGVFFNTEKSIEDTVNEYNEGKDDKKRFRFAIMATDVDANTRFFPFMAAADVTKKLRETSKDKEATPRIAVPKTIFGDVANFKLLEGDWEKIVEAIDECGGSKALMNIGIDGTGFSVRTTDDVTTTKPVEFKSENGVRHGTDHEEILTRGKRILDAYAKIKSAKERRIAIGNKGAYFAGDDDKVIFIPQGGENYDGAGLEFTDIK